MDFENSKVALLAIASVVGSGLSGWVAGVGGGGAVVGFTTANAHQWVKSETYWPANP